MPFPNDRTKFTSASRTRFVGRKENLYFEIRTSDLAELLGISVRQVKRLIASGELAFTGDLHRDIVILFNSMSERGML